MNELISKAATRSIVERYSEHHGITSPEQMSADKFQDILTDIVYHAINAIDKEALRNIANPKE